MAVGQNQLGSHFGIVAPLVLEPILVGIGMFTGGTSWILTHGQRFLFLEELPEAGPAQEPGGAKAPPARASNRHGELSGPGIH